MMDAYTFLHGIYAEFERQQVYNSTIFIYRERQRRRVAENDIEDEYADEDDETPHDHLFVAAEDGPLPGGFTFSILEDNIRHKRVPKGHQVWLADVCISNNLYSGWRVILEIV